MKIGYHNGTYKIVELTNDEYTQLKIIVQNRKYLCVATPYIAKYIYDILKDEYKMEWPEYLSKKNADKYLRYDEIFCHYKKDDSSSLRRLSEFLYFTIKENYKYLKILK